MKIAVIGAGGVGGYFGAQLAAHREDVTFVVRGRTLATLKRAGLRVESPARPVALPRPRATDDPGSVGPVDVVMFTVKMQDAALASRLLPPLVGPDTVVVPFQNGIEASSVLAQAVPAACVAGGVAYISAHIAEPGVVRHVGMHAQLRVGPLVAAQAPRLRAFVDACTAAGIEAHYTDDIRLALWEKFVMLVGLSGLTALARQPIGVVRADPDLRAALVAAMRETSEIARAEGVALAADFVESRMKLVDAMQPDMRASMAHDLEVGKPLEAPWLAGAVARLGASHRVPVPVNATIWAAMKPYLAGRAG